MRSLILSQCRDLRIGVTREDLGATRPKIRVGLVLHVLHGSGAYGHHNLMGHMVNINSKSRNEKQTNKNTCNVNCRVHASCHLTTYEREYRDYNNKM